MALKELVEPDSPLVSIVQYHRVRWLSLSDCVSRLVKLLPLLVQYFEEQAENTHNRPPVRAKCRDLHFRLSKPLFHLYLLFLNPQLTLLSVMNKWFQSTQLTLNVVYCKIQALLKTFVAPIVLDSATSLTDEANLRDMDGFLANLSDGALQKQLSDCEEHSLISSSELKAAEVHMYNYILTIGRALERCFPELDFIVKNTAFVNPTMRSMQLPDMHALQQKFSNGNDPFDFDAHQLTSQYEVFRNDVSIDFEYQQCNRDNVKFWCEVYGGDAYKELAMMALLLLVISPTSVICERGFSTMNYVKNEYRSRLTQENLNASMAIAMADYTVETFPFKKLLKS